MNACVGYGVEGLLSEIGSLQVGIGCNGSGWVGPSKVRNISVLLATVALFESRSI